MNNAPAPTLDECIEHQMIRVHSTKAFPAGRGQWREETILAHLRANRNLLTALETIALHAPSLDADGIREIADAAIAKATGKSA